MRCGLASASDRACGAGAPQTAFANDSTAELTTGGLVLSKNADIEMRSEDLAISEKEISVRYTLQSGGERSDRHRRLSDARRHLSGIDTRHRFPGAGVRHNFLRFHTMVDGREVHSATMKEGDFGRRRHLGPAEGLGPAAGAAARGHDRRVGCSASREAGRTRKTRLRDGLRGGRRQGYGASGDAEMDLQIDVLLEFDFSRRTRNRDRTPLRPERRRSGGLDAGLDPHRCRCVARI